MDITIPQISTKLHAVPTAVVSHLRATSVQHLVTRVKAETSLGSVSDGGSAEHGGVITDIAACEQGRSE
jgi:hypothetical protein